MIKNKLNNDLSDLNNNVEGYTVSLMFSKHCSMYKNNNHIFYCRMCVILECHKLFNFEENIYFKFEMWIQQTHPEIELFVAHTSI